MKILQTISGMSATSGGPSTCTRDLLNGLDAIYPGAVDLLTFESSNSDNLGQRQSMAHRNNRRQPDSVADIL